MSDFKSFMLSGLKNDNTEILTFKGVDTFKDENGVPIPLKFKQISRAAVEEIRKNYTTKTLAIGKDGKYIISNGNIIKDVEVDYAGFSDALIVETMTYPDLKDKELLEFYGVYAGTELLHKLFKGKDYDYVDRCSAQAAGLIDLDETKLVKELKN
ncbi:MAG: hypothetical protein Q4D26_09660 [Clostridia bacterium]|nr:hypothetical protein [Clostridia bacterium]